jgi:hypothetical protein
LHQVVLLLLVLLRWQQYQQLRPVSLHQVLLLPLLCWQQYQQLRPASLHQVLLLPLLCWQQYQQLRPASLHQVLLLPLLRWQQYQQLRTVSLHQACRCRPLLPVCLQQQLQNPVHGPHWQPLRVPAVGCLLSGMPSASLALAG